MGVDNRDVGSAPKRISVHPGTCAAIAAEFPGGSFEMAHDVILFRLTFPFGCTSGTWAFYKGRDFITQMHRSYWPLSKYIDGRSDTHIGMFVGDGVLIDVDIGTRLSQISDSWGY